MLCGTMLRSLPRDLPYLGPILFREKKFYTLNSIKGEKGNT